MWELVGGPLLIVILFFFFEGRGVALLLFVFMQIEERVSCCGHAPFNAVMLYS